jgi:ArsR family transcriptional regulator, arsenate/arsenite/antimonite-responsive transcriptional repressor
MADIFDVVADATRRDILGTLLAHHGDGGSHPSEISVSAIVAELGLSQPTVSKHLKVLREAGLVNERRDGTRHLFSVNHVALRELRDHLAWMWDDSLADLKQLAEGEAKKVKRRGR